MKKKIIFMVVCIAMLLFLTSSSYALDYPPDGAPPTDTTPNDEYNDQGSQGGQDLDDPWDHLQADGQENENSDVGWTIVDFGFYYIFYPF
jgi:hypothetical protein